MFFVSSYRFTPWVRTENMKLHNPEESKMKKQLLFLVCFINATLLSIETRDFPPIILTDPKLKLVDGFSWAMDGKQYKKTMKFRLQLNQRRFGEKTQHGLVGIYTFEGTKYSLQMLIELEEKYSKNSTSADQKRLNALQELLHNTIIEEFVELSQPFLADARGAKKDMMALITEWSIKAARKDSHLLEWGASKEGEETQVVRTKIKTIKEFDQFCCDLVYFLETLMRSCPIATEQFKELLKQEQAQVQKQ